MRDGTGGTLRAKSASRPALGGAFWRRIGCAVLAAGIGGYGCSSPKAGLPRRTFKIGDHEVELEIVADDATRTRGMGFRDRLAEGEGMLFVFEEESPRSFWMKNCLIDLSIAFLDKSGRILNILEMKAEKTGTPDAEHAHYPSSGPSLFAIEMSAGWFERHGVSPGTVVEIPEDVRRMAR